MLGIGLSVPQIAGSSTAFTPAKLFAAGEQGAWYDPSDFSTMFQDSAGTTPVTAVEQPVGLILDKSGRNNNASQATAGSRPTLSAKVNLLTYTEQFDNAVWVKDGLNAFGSGSVANTTDTTDPLGGNTADFIQENTSNSVHTTYVGGVPVSNGTTYTYIVHCKAAGRTWAYIRLAWLPGQGAFFNLENGTVGTVEAGVTAPPPVDVGGGWYRCSVSITSGTTNIYPAVGIAAGDNQGSYTGNGTSGIYIWGADLRVTNDGVGLPAYQRVTTNTDYDTGFPLYLRFDGSNDNLATASINFSGTSKMTLFAGVRKLSDAATGSIVESSPNFTVAGGFGIYTGTAAYSFLMTGATGFQGGATQANYAAPITSVLQSSMDISQLGYVGLTGRVNSASVALSYSGAGVLTTGNFGNYIVYIGRTGGASNPFNGRLYSLIVRGAQSTNALITNTETWVNGKTGAY